MEAPSLQLGSIVLFLPDASDPDFWFGHDIAGMLGHATNAEARSAVEEAIREDAERPRGKLDVDHEADAVWFRARRPDPVVHAARVLHRLAGAPLPQARLDSVLEKARAWRRTRPQKWRLGDLFSVPLRDASFAFGQVVGQHMTGPTLLLFEGRAPAPLAVDEILELGFITILHTDGTRLDSSEFEVLGNAEPSVDPSAGPWGTGGTSTSDSALTQLAHAWYGLEPWNVLHDEQRWDKLLFRGRPRPASAQVLSREDRTAYRREHFGVDE